MSRREQTTKKGGKYHISDETKFKQGRCSRLREFWIPWILATEFSSLGTRAIIIDWKTGRQVHCLSLGERAWYLINRWDDNITDINEQVVLYRKNHYETDPPLIGTTAIAKEIDVKPINGGRSCGTSDFRVFYEDGSVEVVSLKPSEEVVFGTENVELRARLAIEQDYWNRQSVPWQLSYASDLNYTLADNIALVTKYYDKNEVYDDVSYLKHLIATKQVSVDMESEILNFGEMIRHGI